ncbi:MAG: hypothetical protein ABI877_10225 [Gemmatimonadaceae bacterium]
MPLLRRIRLATYLISITAVGCADPSSPVDPSLIATLRFVNAMGTGEAVDVVVGNKVVRSALAHGDVFEWRLAPSTTPVLAGIRAGSRTQTVQLHSVEPSERVLFVAHGTTLSLGVLAGDTNSVRFDRVNVRIAFVAANAPLVKAYVQPETQSALGPLPWVSTQSAYSAPLFTPYYRAAPSAQRLTVIFAEYNPGGAEHILAVSEPFEATSASAWLVTFDRNSTGYVAIVAREPVLFPLD